MFTFRLLSFFLRWNLTDVLNRRLWEMGRREELETELDQLREELKKKERQVDDLYEQIADGEQELELLEAKGNWMREDF